MTACPFKLTKSREVWWPSVSAVILLTSQKIITHHLSDSVWMHPVIRLYFSPHSKARHLRLHACMLQRLLRNNIVEQQIFTQNCLRLKEDLMKTKLSPSVSLGCLQNAESIFSSLSASSHGLQHSCTGKETCQRATERERGKKTFLFLSPCFN